MKNLLFCFFFVASSIVAPLTAHAEFSVSVNIAPPELPVYVQPPIPGDGYMWTPGYWAWSADDNGYYWVPGTWIQAPYVGALWTPGYWGWFGDSYVWHQGYWGDHIGFYGGVNYGFGYVGTGYLGGHWDHGEFAYNTAVNNVTNVHVTNVYNTTVVNNVTRVSYNGGTGGVRMQPSPSEVKFAQAQHTAPLPAQIQHEQAARGTPELRASTNHGVPPIAATPTPGKFSASNIVAAKGAAAPMNPHPVVNANPGENGQHPGPQSLPQPRAGTQPPPQQQQFQQHSAPQPQQQASSRPQPQEMHQPQPRPVPHEQPQEQHQQAPQPHGNPAPHEQSEQERHHE
jgi:hypothetical protein